MWCVYMYPVHVPQAPDVLNVSSFNEMVHCTIINNLVMYYGAVSCLV